MNIVAQASAIAGRARTGAARGRMAVPAAVAIAAIAGISGCSSSVPATPNVPATPAAATASPTATSSAPVTSPSPTPAAVPSAPATPAPSAPAGTAAGTAGGAPTAKVTILGSRTGLVPGGSAMKFMVTVTNTTAQSYSNILPLVSLSHCFCTANTLFPAGTLQERESTTNVWQTIPYDVEGFGTDYLQVDEPGGIQELDPGAIATFEYRVALSPATSAQVTRGAGAFDVTLIALPGRTQIGTSPAASAPIDVQSGQPPA
jgi:hypothetical protein